MKFKASMLTLGTAVALGGLVAATAPARAACAGQSNAMAPAAKCAGAKCSGTTAAKCAGQAAPCAAKCKAK